MSAQIIDGKKVSAAVLARLQAEAAAWKDKTGATPGLAVVLAGEDPASAVYVRNKNRTCREIGFNSYEHTLPAAASEESLLALIRQLNADARVHGILVQLPLPAHIDGGRVLAAIDPAKDVDGFHPVNAGLLAQGGGGLVPCTPAGVIELLDYYGIEIAGQRAVVLGRSNIVGKPMALLLLQRHATVTICHSRTRGMAEVTAAADILVAAIGKPNFVTAGMVKPGAVVIDVGINRVDGKLTGDVAFAEAAAKAACITPVPGGVGPMTIAMLMRNTLLACKSQSGARAGG